MEKIIHNVIVKTNGEISYIHEEKSTENTPLFNNMIESLKQFTKRFLDEDFLNFSIESSFDPRFPEKKPLIISYFKMASIEIILCSTENINMREIYQEWAHALTIDQIEYFRDKLFNYGQ
ncbi:hypothetical protein M153_1000155081 [Pseudoloma neurophilia]|uniref:Uncharacterized protein n=1 Tax=Pseudoloma neurophilia TaxID=146866 RepID=A0A0R0M905_9MICR|nr:hypothetical protein M153_1000155081 [Pseudoloma neurophilia]